MHLTKLEESGLEVSRDQLASAFAPFVESTVGADEPAWRDEIRRRKRKILRKYLRQLVLGWLPAHQRSESAIIEEYTKAWHESEYAKYSLAVPLSRISPWEWNGHHMFASDIGATRFRQILLSSIIDRVRPRRVLEVGCGNGMNLMLLACRYPDIEFVGLELTEQGHKAATGMQDLPDLPEDMKTYAPLPLSDTSGFKRIDFRQGTAAAMPFDDGSFDLVYSVLALEQMEQVRSKALSEIARVSRSHTFMIEPFYDVNSKGWPRRNVVRRNYFRGRIGDLPRFGLNPILATDDFPQETFLKACAVLSEKTSRPA
jgi:ubiquinone/menaquinone biosynthesis C-methylase UbiE